MPTLHRLTCLAALAFAATPGIAEAQGGSPAELKWSGGLLGWGWTLEIGGPSFSGYVLAPSFGMGPTPLALVDPGDPRFLSVGLDLVSFWRFGLLGPSGSASETFLLPPNTSLVGADLRAQAVMTPGSQGLFGNLSNPVVTRLSLPGSIVQPQGLPNAPRADHAQILLLDGRVLLAGGRPLLGSSLGLEWYEPQTQSFEKSDAALPEQLFHQGATLLNDGRVLLTGGVDANGDVSRRSFVYDPNSDKLVEVAAMAAARVLHTTTLLPNGRVLVTGGSVRFAAQHPLGFPDSLDTPIATCETFDPQNESWQGSPALPNPLTGHAATRVPNGSVVVSGGSTLAGSTPLSAPEVWERSAGSSWTFAGVLLEKRAFHSQILSASGSELLIASGAEIDGMNASVSGLGTCESWSHAQGQSAVGPNNLGIVVGGEEVCIPVPTLPKFPSGELGLIREPDEVPTQGPPIVYAVGGGYTALSYGPGTNAANGADQGTIGFEEDWLSIGSSINIDPGHRVTSIDGGLRRLVVSPQGALLVTFE